MSKFTTTLYGWNQKVCEERPVFTEETISAVDPNSIEFLVAFELNTGVGDVVRTGDPSFVEYDGELVGRPGKILRSTGGRQCEDTTRFSRNFANDPKNTFDIQYISLARDRPSELVLTVVWPENSTEVYYSFITDGTLAQGTQPVRLTRPASGVDRTFVEVQLPNNNLALDYGSSRRSLIAVEFVIPETA